MSYDPTGTALFPEPGPLDDDEPRRYGSWRRNAGNQGGSYGDRLAAEKADKECERIGRERMAEIRRLRAKGAL